MNKLVSRESLLVQNGTNLANVVWAGANIALVFQDPALGLTFLASNYVGTTEGQTNTGVVKMMVIGLLGHGQMIASGFEANKYGSLIAGVGGLLVAGCAIADNWNGSKYATWLDRKPSIEDVNATKIIKTRPPWLQLKDNVATILDKPGRLLEDAAHRLSQSANNKIKKFGNNMIDITQRPNFRAAVIGAVLDTGYAVEGLVLRNYIQAGVGISWVAAWGMFGLATPKDGQKNIFTEWYKTARDKINKKDKPKHVKDRDIISP